MPTSSLPNRSKTRHRPPLPPAARAARGRQVRLVAAGLIFGVGAMTVWLLADVPVAAVIVAALSVALLVVVVDPGDDLLATTAPQPLHGADLVTSVSTMRVEVIRPAPGVYPERESAVAEAVRVYRQHALVPPSDTPPGVIPQVTV